MAIVTKTIGTVGRDYATITLWEADLDNGAVYSAADDAVGECYNDSDFDESVTINGGGSIGLNSVKLSVAAGERHDGTAGTGVRMLRTGNLAFVVSTPSGFNENYIVEWLEVDMNGNEGPAFTMNGQSFQHVASLQNLIAHGQSGGNSYKGIVQSDTRDTRVQNSIFYDNVRNTSITLIGLNLDADRPSGGVYNNTVYGMENSGSGDAVGIDAVTNSANHTSRNNISLGHVAGGTTFDFTYGGTNSDSDYNMSSDTTADDAGGSNHVQSVVAADQFVSTLSGSEDLHLKAGADAIGVGVDLVTTPSGVEVDINGRDRNAQNDTWDIGAHQIPTASGISVNLGLSTETDSALAIGAVNPREYAIGLPVHTNTALAISAELGTPLTIGYVSSATYLNINYEHTNSIQLFYGPNDTWWGPINNASNDIILAEWDVAATPASPGLEGGWTDAANSAGGGILIDSRGAGRPILRFDKLTNKLHVLKGHSSTEYYSQYSYNSGSNDWTEEFLDEVPISVTAETEAISFGIDSNSIPFVVFLGGSSGAYTINTRYRDTDDTWKDGGDVEATASTITNGDARISAVFNWDNAGVSSIGVCYTWVTGGVGYHKFAYRADSDTKTDDWTVTTIQSGISVDAHISAVAATLGSDTTSTIVVVVKQTSGDYLTHRRNAAGTWDHTSTSDFASATRVKLTFDKENGEVYAWFSDGVSINYCLADATTAIVWAPEEVFLRDDGVIAFDPNIAVPESTVDSTSNLMILAVSGVDTWWNTKELVSAAYPVSLLLLNRSIANYGGMRQ